MRVLAGRSGRRRRRRRSRRRRKAQEDVFCEPAPELVRKLGLGHYQCVRLLKAVYGLVNAPRRWYQRVSKDLKNLGGAENETGPCVWTFLDHKGEIIGLVLLCVDDALVACANNRKGKPCKKRFKGFISGALGTLKFHTVRHKNNSGLRPAPQAMGRLHCVNGRVRQ